MATVVVIAGVICVLGAVVSFILLGKHPEDLGSPRLSRPGEATGRDTGPGAVRARPAGPGTGNMNAERPGGLVPPGDPPG